MSYAFGMDAQEIVIALGMEIRAEAAARRISLTKLATDVEINRASLYRYLDGERSLPLDVYLAISARLNLTPDTLMKRAEQRARHNSET